jgi:hypothetical protein
VAILPAVAVLVGSGLKASSTSTSTAATSTRQAARRLTEEAGLRRVYGLEVQPKASSPEGMRLDLSSVGRWVRAPRGRRLQPAVASNGGFITTSSMGAWRRVRLLVAGVVLGPHPISTAAQD